MTPEAWITLAVIGAAVVTMARGWAAPDIALSGSMAVLLLFGIITPREAAEGFGNEGMLTVAVLFVVAAGIEATGALDRPIRRLLGQPSSVGKAQLRMMLPMALLSSVLNNTPVVAMLLPTIQDWAKRIGVSPSKLLIPLSWATIMGGTLTIIGTSTNLVVTGLASQRYPELEWSLFEIFPVGAIVVVVGLTYILLVSRWLLPDRRKNVPDPSGARDYTAAFMVEPGSPIIGTTIEAAGLRHLPGLYLVEIERDSETLPAVPPDTRLRENDILVFVGMLESVVDLRKIRGLVPAAADQVARLGLPDDNRRLVEAVVAFGSSLVGHTVKQARFRTRFQAAIIAVHRNGDRVVGKIGDIVLRIGDTLLLETRRDFMDTYRNDRSFALVSAVSRSTPVRHGRGTVALVLLAAMIISNVSGLAPLFTAGLVCAGAMLVTRCMTSSEARRALELNVLLAIAASFSAGRALEVTGAAEAIGNGLVAATSSAGQYGLILAVYLAVMLLTELITNNAAAALMLPVALAAGTTAGIDIKPMCYVVMFAASASFMTPIGYQTNLMVYGPGGYRFSDFVRFGAPLQLLLGLCTSTAIYFLYVV
jgi:di/tricarboxylate transporter